MNYEVERYEGELRELRNRVKELEKELDWVLQEMNYSKSEYLKSQIEYERFW